VADQQPFRLGLQFDNQRPPSVGAEEFSLVLADLSLTGNSDPLRFRYGIANAGPDGLEWSGANNLEGSYELPLTRYDTTLGLHGSRLNTSIVEASLQPLDITSLTRRMGAVLRQPLYQSVNQEFALSVGFDYADNTSWLLGDRFNVSPGSVDGNMTDSVLRFSQEWLRRGPDYVVALRSTFNFGLDVFGSTDDGMLGDPDGTFFSWLGQGQYVQRLFHTQNEMVVRLTGQCTPDPLLALDQISVGGFYTVRGYLENQLVRDRGLVASLEFRVPVLFQKSGASLLQLAPFLDFGGGWNNDESPSPTTIWSVGVGLRFTPFKYLSAEVYWGHRLREVSIPDDAGLQGEGVGLRVNVNAF
jgi:hemolysin activation/secretion protein